ncbi:MAG: transposase [Burkholderiaceae bacterium]|nr:transposase [Burkholderiaceae bacterium]MDH3460145.1 transposase [Burkholderiaceae bacterium]
MSYPSDFADKQWAVLEPALWTQRTSRRGRPVAMGLRRVTDAILYVVKAGCPCRQLRREFGAWETVYSHYRRMRERGTWERALKALREQARTRAGRHPRPTVAIIDSRSVKTTGKGGSAAMTRARKPGVASDT